MDRLRQAHLAELLFAEQHLLEVGGREAKGDFGVDIQDVFGLALQEALVDEVEEEFEELGAGGHQCFHLLQVVLHVVHVQAVYTFEVECRPAQGPLVGKDHYDDLGFRQV